MVKTLARSIREYKKSAILTPLLVTVEVILECIIPFIIANLVNQMQAGCGMDVIVNYGIQLVVMAVLSLIFGVAAGNTCATASTGFARNLRKDMFYHIQDYSFENIDKFSVSSLVTRMTTDVVNVQMSFMMIIRVAIRGPLMLIFSFVMGFVMGGRLAMIFLVTIPLLSICFSTTSPAFLRILFIHTIPQWRTESYRTKENKRKTLGAHRSGSFSALAFGALTGLAASTENSSGWIACSKSRKLRCISRLMK